MKIFQFIILLFCTSLYSQKTTVITTDIDNFWKAYDKISATTDSVKQYSYLNALFIAKGTPGLQAFMETRGYTTQSYIQAINSYPKFWQSVRKNTLKAKWFGREIEAGIQKLKTIYPDLKPAPVYFTIGAMRSGGTVRNGMVLIGSEMALTDKNTVSSELPAETAAGRRVYFDSNPINDVVLLNVHEYVHTQQNELVHNLLSYVIYEGVAEFVSVKAMETQSAAPAIAYGKQNDEKVRKKFEQEMFSGRSVSKWLWSDAPNEFNTRDLGYYIGYALCERYYNAAADKKLAIKQMIELDYTNEKQIEDFVHSTKYFSAPLDELYKRYDNARPTVTHIMGVDNNSPCVTPGTKTITVHFSVPMDASRRNFDYGPLGENNVLAIQKLVGFSADGRSITFEVTVEAGRHYQLTVADGFTDLQGYSLKPYVIDISTTK